MRLIGNIIWLLPCGLLLGLGWALVGLLWCITIVGIPVGVQCFKFARLSFWPFGRDIILGSGPVSILMNILWLIFGGVELAVTSAVFGLVFFVTIIGIPFGKQCFKLAELALLPFGARIVRSV